MRKSIYLLLTIVMTSCATYRAKPLENLPSENLTEVSAGLAVGYKKFNLADRMTYLGTTMKWTCFEAVQLTFENETNTSYLFDADTLSLSAVPPAVVLCKARYYVIPRFLAYAVAMPIAGAALASLKDGETGPLMFIPLFPIGVILGSGDAVLAMVANRQMRKDYLRKAPQTFSIDPHTTSSILFFVNKLDYQDCFSFTLSEDSSVERIEIAF